MPTQQGFVADPASHGMPLESSGPVKHAHRDLELPPPNKQKALPAGAPEAQEMLHAGTNPSPRASCARGKPSSGVSNAVTTKPDASEGVSLRAAAGIAAAPSSAALGSSHKAVKRTAAAVAISDDQEADTFGALTAVQTSLAAPAAATQPVGGNPCWKSALLYGTAAAAVVAVTSPQPANRTAEHLPPTTSSQPGASKPPALPSSTRSSATQQPAAPSSNPHVGPPRGTRAVRVRYVRALPRPTPSAAAPSLSGPSIVAAANGMPPSPAAAPALPERPSSSSSSGSEGSQQEQRRVRFARGHLDPASDPTAAPDGHPATEGCQVAPVRHLPQSYALDLTRGNVLMLEQMLGEACRHSICRLKRRVGLLPPIRAPRPYLCSRPLPQPISSTPAAAAAVGSLGGAGVSNSTPLHTYPYRPLGLHGSGSGSGTHSSSPRCKHTVSRVGASRSGGLGSGGPGALSDGALLRDQA